MKSFVLWMRKVFDINVFGEPNACSEAIALNAQAEELRMLEDDRDNCMNEIGLLKEDLARKDAAIVALKKLVSAQAPGISATDYKSVYFQLQSTLDENYFVLYHAAREILGAEEVWEYFPIEDNIGYFEVADGQTLIKYLEIHFFAQLAEKGSVSYEEFAPGVEVIGEIIYDEDALGEFRRKMYKKAVKNILGE